MEHIVVDLTRESLPFTVTLVVAHKTSSGEELIDRLSAKAAGGEPHMFIAVIPQQDRSGAAHREARIRLGTMLERLDAAGLLSAGMIGDPDPYTATINALELFKVDDIIISTLPKERSGWLRSNLIERVGRRDHRPCRARGRDARAQRHRGYGRKLGRGAFDHGGRKRRPYSRPRRSRGQRRAPGPARGAPQLTR